MSPRFAPEPACAADGANTFSTSEADETDRRTMPTQTKPHLTVVPLKPKPRRRAEERWGKAVIDRGFTVLPSMLFWAQARLKLTPDEFNVVLQLAAHWWDANEDPRPAKDTIAERMGKDPRTIQRYLTQLEQKGLLRRIARYRPGRGQGANAYSLEGLVKCLGELEPEFRKVIEQNRIRRQRVERPREAIDA
jgi:Helix-turn-helix domain